MAMMQRETPKAASVEPIKGDMIGDKPVISEHHYRLADTLIPYVLKAIAGKDKAVVAVGGPSGSGKSETASLIAGILASMGKPAYTLSCDNYPHKPPRTNEEYREQLFSKGGEQALADYLGTPNEIDFERLTRLVTEFKAGNPQLLLRIMDNPQNQVADNARPLDCKQLSVLVLEGTWSNLVEGVDLKIFLDSTPEETRAHRIARGRDPDQDSEVTKIVLRIEQGKLEDIAAKVSDVVINRQYQVVRSGIAC